MLRAAAEAGTLLGLKAKPLMDRGELVPDDLVIGIIGERFDQPDCVNGAIFDGFPRTIPQAEALDRMLEQRGKQIGLVIELSVKDEVLVSRVESRIRQGGALRGDDTPETLRHRLGVYYKNTAPLLEFYGKQNKVVSVDGMLPIEEVTLAIAAAIDGQKS
jgi:adenylate kinase